MLSRWKCSSKLQTEIFSKAPILHVLCCVSVDGSHTFMRISWAVWCVFLYVSLCSASALERSSTITLLMGGWVVVGGWEAEGEGRWEWGKVLCRVESGVSNVHTGTFSMHTHLAAHTKQHTHINMDTSTRHTHTSTCTPTHPVIRPNKLQSLFRPGNILVIIFTHGTHVQEMLPSPPPRQSSASRMKPAPRW